MRLALDRSAAAEKTANPDVAAAVRDFARRFEENPRDWTIGNTLGDLYVQSGRSDAAVAHFARLAEQLAADGFAAKARALYRKILRIQPAHATAQQRVHELESQQAANVSPFLRRVLDQARSYRATAAVPPPVVEPIVTVPPAAPVAAPPPIVEKLPEPVSQPETGEEWIDVMGLGDDEAPAEAAAPAPETPTAAESEAFWQESDAFGKTIRDATAAVERGDFRAALADIQTFLRERPNHVPAIERLIEITCDAGLVDELMPAQVRLAEACLAEGRYAQALYIAEDLVARAPQVRRHHELIASALAEGREHGVALAAPPALDDDPPPPDPAPPEPETDEVFEEVRRALVDDAATAAEERFAEATRFVQSHRVAEAIGALEDAMCAPHLRVSAGSRLAHIHLESGDAAKALACLEWVAEVPPATDESGRELAYVLAVTLETLGQDEQALGIFRELLSDAGPTYRDVADHAQRLAGDHGESARPASGPWSEDQTATATRTDPLSIASQS